MQVQVFKAALTVLVGPLAVGTVGGALFTSVELALLLETAEGRVAAARGDDAALVSGITGTYVTLFSSFGLLCGAAENTPRTDARFWVVAGGGGAEATWPAMPREAARLTTAPPLALLLPLTRAADDDEHCTLMTEVLELARAGLNGCLVGASPVGDFLVTSLGVSPPSLPLLNEERLRGRLPLAGLPPVSIITFEECAGLTAAEDDDDNFFSGGGL